MTVLITLTTATPATGPFNLYSDLDGFAVPFESGVSKAALLAGYTSNLVPYGTSYIRVVSFGTCNIQTDILIGDNPSTTTTTSTSSTSTTTTTTSSTSTTTTTTTAFSCLNCNNWTYSASAGDVIHYYSCANGSFQSIAVSEGDSGSFCNCDNSGTPYTDYGNVILTQIGSCP